MGEMSDAVLQKRLPEAPWMDAARWRLPGTVPIDPSLWLMQDDAFAGQMAERDRLIRDWRDAIVTCLDAASDAAQECLDLVLDTLRGTRGYKVEESVVQRPDGIVIPVDRTQPMETTGRLIQEDICILQDNDQGEHVLTGACLCFPASWTLSEKIGRPLTRIHAPVAEYSEDVSRRVQRLFNAIRPEVALMRANALLYARPDLHQPRLEGDTNLVETAPHERPYLRSERQVLRRLPDTGAVVFSIHTFVVPLSALTTEQRDSLGPVLERYAARSEHPE